MTDKIPFSIALAASVLIAGALCLAAMFAKPMQAQGSVSLADDCPTSPSYELHSLLNATTSNATSTEGGGGSVSLSCAKNVTFYFSRGDTTGQGNSGSTRFEVEVTPDGTNWYDYNGLVLNNVSAGSVMRPTVGTSTISAATSTVIATMDVLGFYAARCIAIETTDGEHTCKAAIEY